ncbi:hypothetical protein YC2023_051511 [Brassica napus]
MLSLEYNNCAEAHSINMLTFGGEQRIQSFNNNKKQIVKLYAIVFSCITYLPPHYYSSRLFIIVVIQI